MHTKTRHLSRREAVNLLVDFAEAYAIGQEEGRVWDKWNKGYIELEKLTERLLRHLTGKDPKHEDMLKVYPY